MSESFKELFEKSIAGAQFYPGAIISAKVINIDDDYVTLNAGLKSEGIVAIEEFQDKNGDLEVNVGDTVEVALDSVEDGHGETILSREKAKRQEAWRKLSKSYENNETVTGLISGKVKGGFTVEIGSIRAFLPGSLVDVRPVRDPSYLEGKELEFKVIKMDLKRNNIVVSRRAVVEEESSADRQALLDSLHEGQVLQGIVKNLTDYGAFIDLGGIDGLLHITDISWKRVKHPSEVLTVGQDVKVKVLSFDSERNRVSLGMKQLGNDPWVDLVERYPIGRRMQGKVTNITDYGCFVEIEEGVEGLVHMSEMDWTNKNIHPSKVVSLGDLVEVMVLEIDEDRRRISLGMKQCVGNPWQKFAQTHNKGEKVRGKIRSITDFGIFIGLEGEIDGLVHLSDISWDIPGEEAVKQYKKGQELEAVILAIDAERERISLGLKQLESDNFTSYVEEHSKGTIVKGKVTSVDAKAVVVELAEDVFGTIRANELSDDKVDDASTLVKEGDELEAKITNIDRKNRSITLSVKAKDAQDQAEAIKKYSRTGEATTTLGDLLKEKMASKEGE
ncbi:MULTISPECIES: 30S ribosomal protein S1 [Legionella]|uniref:30S ribosomal protein S1 n=1 Tax=Legionella septentrionalis TaxID=2498109 RepID=A0A3S1CM31_9GAMM|nr:MULTISPECIES: 30S ribosomal protein S1 [Legionella]MCP0913517.1 30S ribosomal protein S1 [Legionella sp. 27cVA30]RUQ89709.1 30S ribosomal protein S1 [Legionella septentrionalis]RUQ99746.1 30S ribosomal protein S1 [Legionella septentrionalis]RUR11060.1 30S ribosomal protein S1 [Legionella septentrionalis]RUR15222.1 30S ribosomal protein S1 [Legionella septentrionalis]